MVFKCGIKITINPPFNYHPWNQDKLLDDVRWKYGIPPAGNANYAWIQHMIHHLAPNGKIGLVLANADIDDMDAAVKRIYKFLCKKNDWEIQDIW